MNRHALHRSGAIISIFAAALLVVVASGCSKGPAMTPVRGVVYLDDKPLEFGSVMFQPPGGQPARAAIGPDGSFVLTTDDQDGAVIGLNKVRVTCYESQRPGAKSDAAQGEAGLGTSLIPLKYTKYHTSGIEVDVQPGQTEPVQIRLVREDL